MGNKTNKATREQMARKIRFRGGEIDARPPMEKYIQEDKSLFLQLLFHQKRTQTFAPSKLYESEVLSVLCCLLSTNAHIVCDK